MARLQYVNTENNNDVVSIGEILNRYVDINGSIEGFERYVKAGFRKNHYKSEYKPLNDRLMLSEKAGEGYYFVSKNNIIYDILQGISIKGVNYNAKSDIVFIFLSNPNINIEDLYVCYFFGASCIKGRENEYEDMIRIQVDLYEKRNGISQ
jgi:hypothetical protein